MTSIPKTTTEYGKGSFGTARPDFPMQNWQYYQVQSLMGREPTEEDITNVTNWIDLTTREPWTEKKEPNLLERLFNKFSS